MDLFNHLVGDGEQPWREAEAECLSGVEVDHELELDRLLTATIAFDGKDLASRLDRAIERAAKLEEQKEPTTINVEPVTATPILPVPERRFRR